MSEGDRGKRPAPARRAVSPRSFAIAGCPRSGRECARELIAARAAGWRRRRRRRLAEGRLQGRGTGRAALSSVIPSAEASKPRRGTRQGAEPGRADPRGERGGDARRARRADRRDPARVRLRQRRDRQLQRGRPRDRAACCPRTQTPRRAASRGDRLGASGRGSAVVIADSFGRAWRIGQAEVAIGCAGARAARRLARAPGRQRRELRRRRSRSPTRRPPPPIWSGTRRRRCRRWSAASAVGHRGGRPRRGGDTPAARGRPLPLGDPAGRCAGLSLCGGRRERRCPP